MYPTLLVERSRRTKLRAACLGPGIKDRLLREFGGYPMCMLDFPYILRGFCMFVVGQWLVSRVGLEPDEIKNSNGLSEVEVTNKNLLDSLISQMIINK